MRSVPLSAVLTAWGNAWLTGHVGLDEAVDAIERAGGPNVVTALPGEPGELPLRRGLAVLRHAGLTALHLAAPTDGDPLGLAGPRAFTVAAVAAGEAVLAELTTGCVGLVPAADRRGSSYAGVRWSGHPADPRTAGAAPTLAEADHQLTLAIRDATRDLAGLDTLSAQRPDVAEALAELRTAHQHGPAGGLAPGYPARAHRVAALAGRLAIVVNIALTDARAHAAEDRRTPLRALDQALRRALVAACDSLFEPTH